MFSANPYRDSIVNMNNFLYSFAARHWQAIDFVATHQNIIGLAFFAGFVLLERV